MTASAIELKDGHVGGCAGDVEDKEDDTDGDIRDGGGDAAERGSSGWLGGREVLFAHC